MSSRSVSRCLLSLWLLCGTAGTALADGAMGLFESKSFAFFFYLVLASPFLLFGSVVYAVARASKRRKAQLAAQQHQQPSPMPPPQPFHDDRWPR